MNLPAIAPPSVQAAAQALADADRAQRAAERAVQALRHSGLREARALDVQATVDAEAAGRKPPGRKHEEAARKQLEQAEFTAEVSAESAQRARKALHAAVEAHRTEWEALIAERLQAALQRSNAALDELHAAAAEVASADSSRYWLRRVEEQGLAQTLASSPKRLAHPTELRTRDGQYASAHAALQALDAMRVDPQEAREQGRQRMKPRIPAGVGIGPAIGVA